MLVKVCWYLLPILKSTLNIDIERPIFIKKLNIICIQNYNDNQNLFIHRL